MSSTSETGMARMLGSFNKLIEATIHLGEDYKPANAQLAIKELQICHDNATEAMKMVDDALSPYTLIVDRREAAFALLLTLPARIRNAAKSMNAGDAIIADMDTIIRKLRGKTSGPKKPKAKDTEEPVDSISASQQSYDHKVAQFSSFVSLLSHVPAYRPNEKDLQAETLLALIEELDTLNGRVADKWSGLSTARIARNNYFFAPVTGLVDTGNAVKSYIKSVFNAKSQQYALVKNLQFRNR